MVKPSAKTVGGSDHEGGRKEKVLPSVLEGWREKKRGGGRKAVPIFALSHGEKGSSKNLRGVRKGPARPTPCRAKRSKALLTIRKPTTQRRGHSKGKRQQKMGS